MTTFPTLDASESGARLANTWLTAIANNIANVETVRPAGQAPFRAQQVTAAPVAGGGVKVAAITEQTGTPDRVYEPGNPLADADGFITRPVVNLADEMTSMLMAQRLYQMNLAVHQQVRDSYRAAMQIGKT